ncbi:MAG TPA: bifunctional glutamate N-acetyltransferase/amino-acid acetyltransferase ArgJ [Acidimicrobiales bacterium]|nr:bifunctional glutamate N-acetyltransferase/amino-acid acetyltransferase ArgJ [Acidimicrobiales bacterium]
MSVTAASGFVAAGGHGGVKPDGVPDLAVVATADGRAVPAAGVFTANRFTASPVVISRTHLYRSNGHAAGVVLNSGNANAGTGEPGQADAVELCAHVARALGCGREQVLICSTGLIGYRLPLEPMLQAIPDVVASATVDGAGDAAQAILTTDTVRKEVVVEGDGFTVGGMAKGAAMLEPNLATMLAVLTTDAEAEPAVLQQVLRNAVVDTFNCITVDGATSTNDTVLLLASGEAGPVDALALEDAVTAACASLAEQMVADAEGATKLVRIHVDGAHSDEEARTAARAVASSQLTKCSWYGEDPYWGRVASDLGSAGVGFDPMLLAVAYGDTVVCRHGVEVEHDRDAVRAHMAQRDLHITAHLGLGSGKATVLTCDLTHAYVDENMGTS